MAETRREAGGPAPAAPAAEGEALRWREVSPPPPPLECPPTEASSWGCLELELGWLMAGPVPIRQSATDCPPRSSTSIQVRKTVAIRIRGQKWSVHST